MAVLWCKCEVSDEEKTAFPGLEDMGVDTLLFFTIIFFLGLNGEEKYRTIIRID
jgi:hypothetical protein